MLNPSQLLGKSSRTSSTTTETATKPSRLQPLEGAAVRINSNNTSSSSSSNDADEQEQISVPAANNVSRNSSLLSSSVQPSKIAPIAPVDKRALSLELLNTGFVHSFVDFFYLTHKRDKADNNQNNDSKSTNQTSTSSSSASSSDSATTIVIPPLNQQQLLLVARLLRAAENGHRQGASEAIFQAYTELAQLFTSRREFRAGIYFSEKKLELASNIGAEPESLEALAVLGKLFDECGENGESIAMYERCSTMSAAHSHSLTAAYKTHADRLYASGSHEVALQFYEKCCAKARETNDTEIEMKALYALGLCYSQQKTSTSSQASAQTYQAGLMLAKQLNDSAMISDLSFALALYHESQHEINLCLNYLELSVYHASRASGMTAGATASNTMQQLSAADLHRLLKGWNKMGEIHSASGNHSEAATMFEKTYELAKRHADQSMMDVARINVGMARANVSMKAFMAMCQEEDLSHILAFKATRVWPQHLSELMIVA